MEDDHPEDSLDKDDDNGELLLDAENEAAFVSSLMNINNTMLAMSESLRQLQNIPQEHVLRSTESAKGKKDELAPRPRSESDIDTTTDMRMQLESSTDETGPDRDCSEHADLLLTEIEQSLIMTNARTRLYISEKLANITNQRWLQQLSGDQLKNKLDKYNRPLKITKNLLSFKLTLKFEENLTGLHG